MRRFFKDISKNATGTSSINLLSCLSPFFNVIIKLFDFVLSPTYKVPCFYEENARN
jgi:hypothetical protein